MKKRELRYSCIYAFSNFLDIKSLLQHISAYIELQITENKEFNNNYEIILVPSKNNSQNWPTGPNMGQYGHSFLLLQSHFWANITEIFYGKSGDYYRSIGGIRGLKLMTDFWGLFGGENGRGHNVCPYGS